MSSTSQSSDHFATLIPCNKIAILAFHRLCNAIKLDPTQYAHHQQFMIIKPRQITLGEALSTVMDTTAAESALSTDATKVSSDCDPLDEHIWTGGYGFDLN
ncbi:hypothetical protein LTR02_017940, partial [Friedmanniomyces endolithicus]